MSKDAKYLKHKIEECILLANKLMISANNEQVDAMNDVTNLLVRVDMRLEYDFEKSKRREASRSTAD